MPRLERDENEKLTKENSELNHEREGELRTEPRRRRRKEGEEPCHFEGTASRRALTETRVRG